MPARAGQIVSGLLDLVLLGSLAAIVVLRFRRALYVTAQSVLAAVAIYLEVGLVFALLGSLLSLLTGRPFFTQVADASLSQYTYFSFITLCTVGYGDLTPDGGLARALAVSEALVGQLYLVTVIAVVVGNVGRQRQRATARLSAGGEE